MLTGEHGAECLLATDESMPGPLWHVHAVRHILCRAVITRHRGRRSPSEVVVQDDPETIVVRESDLFQRPIETCDRSLVHLLVWAVAAVHSDHRGLVAIPFGVTR